MANEFGKVKCIKHEIQTEFCLMNQEFTTQKLLRSELLHPRSTTSATQPDQIIIRSLI